MDNTSENLRPGIDHIGIGCGPLILNDRDETLLFKRKDGGWAKPGGRVEHGETIEEAIRRETREEIGVEIELLEPLGFTEEIVSKDGVCRHWISFHRLARITAGEPRILEPDKHESLRWFPLNDLPPNTTRFTSEAVETYLKLKAR